MLHLDQRVGIHVQKSTDYGLVSEFRGQMQGCLPLFVPHIELSSMTKQLQNTR